MLFEFYLAIILVCKLALFILGSQHCLIEIFFFLNDQALSLLFSNVLLYATESLFKRIPM